MMRHAFIILAYNEKWLLKKLIQFLSHDNCDIYLNLDFGKDLTNEDKVILSTNKHVRFCSYNKLHWGGYSIIKKEIELIRHVVKENRTDYVHIISGQDYPIKPLSFIFDFFEAVNGCSFLDCKPASFREIARRLLYYLPFDFYNARSEKGHKITTFLRRLQGRLHFRRSVRLFPEFMYIGSQWCSLSMDACKHLLDFTSKTRFFQKLNNTFAAEEFYIPTALGNCYDIKKTIGNNNLRFIRWNSENGNNPSNLGIEHFKMLAASKALFARKMTWNVSRHLIEIIDNVLLADFCRKQEILDFEKETAQEIIKILKVIKSTKIVVVGDNLLYSCALQDNGFTPVSFCLSEKAEEVAPCFGLQSVSLLNSSHAHDFAFPKNKNYLLLLVNQMKEEKMEIIFKRMHDVSKVLIVETVLSEMEKQKLQTYMNVRHFRKETILDDLLSAAINSNVYLFLK